MNLKTKRDFQNLLLQIVGPLKGHYSAGKARLLLGHTGAVYDSAAAELEGFSRALWGLAPFFRGGGEDRELEKNCLEGLKSGTDPDSQEYWGPFKDCDQRFVEMAAIAHSLILVPERLWQPLGERGRERLAAWLSCINNYRLPDNNWLLFAVMANAALKKLGLRHDNAAMGRCLDRVESYYLGGGWYSDGPSGHKDYYVSFAIHYCCLLYAAAMQKDDPERCAEYKKRAQAFAQDFIYWFSEDGAGIPYGRSLTYRFAQAAFFSACLHSRVEPFSIPVMKGIISRNLKYWMESPIFDSGNILAIGYKYPNLIMAESYNGPGSPYWALETFLCLALDDGHPFWAADEAPLPALDSLKALPNAEMIISRRYGAVTAYPAGRTALQEEAGPLPKDCLLGHYAEKYSKFAYSSKYGFSIERGSSCLETMSPDSMLVFEINGNFFARSNVLKANVTRDAVETAWQPYPGVRVTTVIKPSGAGHVRLHTIESSIDCAAYDCGFALPTEAKGHSAEAGQGHAEISNAEGFCRVRGGEGVIIEAAPNTNLIHPRAAIPAVRYKIKEGASALATSVEFE